MLMNLHIELNFDLGKENKILKLVKLQSWVVKYCKIPKIQPYEVCKFCICLCYMQKSEKGTFTRCHLSGRFLQIVCARSLTYRDLNV